MGMTKTISILAFTLAMIASSTALADDKPNPDRTTTHDDGVAKLSAFASTGYLGTSGANGGAVSTGVRLALGEHFALGLDLGYGLIATANAMQDRWWLIPSMAVVVPTRIASRKTTFDFGVGFGAGTSSGYASSSEYSAHPFTADWAYQLIPTARAHAIAAMTVTPSLDLFIRADAAAMIMPDGTHATVTDTTWLMFSLGARFRLL
jgi:hypothetical protein